jgi:hypothetical protein
MLDSAAEANNGGQVGTAPNSMVLPVRVGDSFIVDANEFAQGVVFAVDSGARVIAEALGALNSTRFARQAVDYAYRHGVTIIGSAGDEQSERQNFPAAYPHVIMVNSVSKFDEIESFEQTPSSYLYLNGCTNFGGRIDVSVPTASCSSEAAGKSSGPHVVREIHRIVFSMPPHARSRSASARRPGRTGRRRSLAAKA